MSLKLFSVAYSDPMSGMSVKLMECYEHILLPKCVDNTVHVFLLLLVVLVTDQAFVTLATNDSYALGALVLGHSLKVVGTTRCLAVMVTHDVQESLR